MSKGVNVNVDISCDVCCDLIPLVRDGVASADSEALVRAHIAHCESCRALMNAETCAAPAGTAPDDALVLRRLKRGLTVRMVLSVLSGLVAAMVFQYSVFRIWWLPLAGSVCYLLMRRRWVLGILTVAAGQFALSLWRDSLWYNMEVRWVVTSILADTAISVLYLLLGVLVAALLCYALGGLHWPKGKHANKTPQQQEGSEDETKSMDE